MLKVGLYRLDLIVIQCSCQLVRSSLRRFFLTRVRAIKWNLDDVQHGGHRWREYGNGLDWIVEVRSKWIGRMRVLLLGYVAIDSRGGNPVRGLLCFVAREF